MIYIYKQKFTSLQEAIVRLLCIKAGLSLNQRQIAKRLNITSPAVRKPLLSLEKKEIIEMKQDNESKRWSITLNRENHKVTQVKRVDNLKQLYESGLVDTLEEAYAGATIIVFGSYARGDDSSTSDIDIAIIGRKEKKLELTVYEKILERKISIQAYNSLQEVHKSLRENMCNGIVVAGGIEL